MDAESGRRSPYVGPLPFQRKDRGIFFGRVREVNDLVSLIFAHRTVLLYAESGAGKSSLLNAGLVPRLEEEGLEVLPLARVKGKGPECLESDNVYVFNTLRSWQAVLSQEVGGEEEAAQPEAGNAEDPIPAAGQQRSLSDFLQSRLPRPQDDDLAPLRVAIFDQFEELFTFHSERWEDRAGFFDQLNQALQKDSLLRVVLVMREDYIARLDPFVDFLPERLRTRYRLERLRRAAALKAVEGPLDGLPQSFGEGVAEALVEDLIRIRVEASSRGTVEVPGEVVEPVQLQVVCQTLWEGLPSHAAEITKQHLKAYGDPVEALSAFYERSIRETVKRTSIGEGELRRWFENVLITPAGTRGTVHRGKSQTGGISNQAVDALENAHLIRAEWRSGGRWYELNHDRFIEPVKKSNQAWVAERGPAEQIRQRLEEQAARWAAGGRAETDLLQEGELAEAERWRDSPEAVELGIGQTLLALILASRTSLEARERARQLEVEHAKAFADAQARAARRLRRALLAVAAVSVIAVAAAIVAYFQWQKAVESAVRAEAEQIRATQAEAAANEAAANLAHAVGDLKKAKEFEDLAKAANQQVEKLQQTSDQVSDALTGLTNERDALREDLKNVQGERDNLRTSLQAVEDERNVLNAMLGTVRDERDGLKTFLQTVEGERDDLRAKLSAAKSEKENALAEINKLKKQLENKRLPNTAFLPNGVIIEFVQIEPGQFLMGWKLGELDEKPVRRVRITRPFQLGKYEITQRQWEAVMGYNPSRHKGADFPVEQVSWQEVIEFIARLNSQSDGYIYRLPTEAEWEYAARAGTTDDGLGLLKKMAWYAGNSENDTHPVGQKMSNTWGIHDIHGNVWEWVQDWYSEDYYKRRPDPDVDPRGPDDGLYRVIRGGGWGAPLRHCASIERFRYPPAYSNPDLGFRLLRQPK